MIRHVLTVYRLTFDLGQSYRFRACTLGICIRLILSAFFRCISNFRVIAAFLYRSLMQRTGVRHNGKMCSVENGTEQIFCQLDSGIKAWFRRYVEMCIGGFVFQRYGKAHYMVAEFSVICLVVFA